MFSPTLPVSRHDPSVHIDSLSGLSLYYLIFLAASSLLLAKGALVLVNSVGSTHSVYSAPKVASMSILAANLLTNLCPR